MIWMALLFWAQNAAAQQIQRGEAVFLGASGGCAACHSLKGHGTAIGPDLSVLGRVGTRALVTAIRSTATEYVQMVKLKSGESFPGMPAASDDRTAQFYDMSKTPPELRKFDRAEVENTTSQDAWKHPPAVGNLTNQQIADVVAYIRYTATGDPKAVDPDDVE